MPFNRYEVHLSTDITSDSAWAPEDPVGSTTAEREHFEDVVEATIKDALTRMGVADTDYIAVRMSGSLKSKAYRLVINLDVVQLSNTSQLLVPPNPPLAT